MKETELLEIIHRHRNPPEKEVGTPYTTRQKIINLYASGETKSRISRLLGVTRPTVDKYIKELLGEAPKKKKTISKDTQLEIIIRHEQGIPKVKIAKALGVSRPTVDRYVKLGLEPFSYHPAYALLELQKTTDLYTTLEVARKIQKSIRREEALKLELDHH